MILDSSERILVFDCEANGLLHNVTKMWCIYCEDFETGEGFLFHDYPEFDNVVGGDEVGVEFTIPPRSGTLEEGAKFLSKARGLTAHNMIGFDLFLLKMFFPNFKIRYDYPLMRDTMLMSQVLWYDRKPVKGYKGIHNLNSWGARLGIRKPEIQDWSYIDALKLNRCIEDVKINVAVAKQLDIEKQWLQDNCNQINFDQALATENEYRYWCTIQELNGALVDAPHMRECCVELDKLLEGLRVEIEPMLPPSINVKSVRESVHNVATLLGARVIPPKKVLWKVRNGESYQTEEKLMYRPTMRVFKLTKQKMYSVVIDGEEVRGHDFPKVKEAREWAKESYPLVKGIKYPWIEVVSSEYDRFTKNHFGKELEGATEVVGAYTKVEFEESRMSQHEKVKMLLVTLGWQTDEWTYKKDAEGGLARAEKGGTVYWPDKPIQGKQLKESYKGGGLIPSTPKITEDSFQWLPEGLGQKIKEYNTYSHRRKFIENPTKADKGLLNNIREDGKITCGIITYGTTAGRASHHNFVNAPGAQALYGEKIRKIVVAPKGSVLVGIDQPNCHHRVLADFTSNSLYIAAVDGKEEEEDGTYVGKDAHTVNSILFKLNTQEDVDLCREIQDHGELRARIDSGRKKGKAASFGTIYGCSAKKLALILGVSESEAQQIKDAFLNGLGLDLLLKEKEALWKAQKRAKGSYISVLGGYHIWANSKHKIINYTALGSEAVIQKVAIIWVNREIRRLGLKTQQIMSIHDECLFSVPNDELDEAKAVISQMYVEAAKTLGLTLDWRSTAKVGSDYSECH
jgi:hypothetical protein